MQHWIFLSIAIVSEVIATSFLKAADVFTRVCQSLVLVFGYLRAFDFLSLSF